MGVDQARYGTLRARRHVEVDSDDLFISSEIVDEVASGLEALLANQTMSDTVRHSLEGLRDRLVAARPHPSKSMLDSTDDSARY